MKSQRRYSEAIVYYNEAIHIRSNILSNNHNETIISMHNLAECYLANNDSTEATKIQNEILELLDKDKKILKENDNNIAEYMEKQVESEQHKRSEDIKDMKVTIYHSKAATRKKKPNNIENNNENNNENENENEPKTQEKR